MNNMHMIRFAASAVALLAASASSAQSFYVGAEFGSDHFSFEPRYTFVSGAPEQTFDNQAYGKTGGLLLGYRWKAAPDFSLGLQGRLSTSNAEWTLQLPEPAWFEYSVPLSVAFSVVPTYRVSKALSVFGEAGIAVGRLQERKSSVGTSMYDVKEWKTGGVLGAGIGVDLGDQWSARLGYRRTWYGELQYDTHLANGTKVETVRSKPVQNTWTIGVLRSF